MCQSRSNLRSTYQDGDDLILRTVDGATLTLEVTGLTSATSYRFTVQASDATGNWSKDGPSAVVSTLPGAPLGEQGPAWESGKVLLVTAVRETSVTLRWRQARGNVPVVGYALYQDGELLTRLEPTRQGTMVYELTGLAPGQTYVFTLMAKDAEGRRSVDAPTVTVETRGERQRTG